MRTVNEVSKLTGVSVRTLHHYDAIGLLKPTAFTDAGYRLYDDTALEQQITLLTLKKEHLKNLLGLAREIKEIGVNRMDFTAFDTSKIDDYAAEAKAAYGQTPEYAEFAEKSKGRTKEETQRLNMQMMAIFTEFGTMNELPPNSEKVQTQVKKLQNFISEHFYNCSDEVLYSLGSMYSGDGRFTENINKAGGEGTAQFVFEAIRQYCNK